MKEGVLYNITCEECKAQEKKAEYWGETGRDGFTRGGEHLKGCKQKDRENALWKHIEGEHRGKSRSTKICGKRGGIERYSHIKSVKE